MGQGMEAGRRLYHTPGNSAVCVLLAQTFLDISNAVKLLAGKPSGSQHKIIKP